MIVPTYNESVATEGPQQESLAIQPRTEASSGVNIAQAEGGIGKEAESLGAQVTRHLIYQQRMADQQKSYDISSQYARAGQQFLMGDGNDQPGILNLQGNDAAGALAKFQDWDAKQRQQLLNGLPADEQKNVSRLIDSHGTVFFDNVLRHQVKQTEVAQDNSRVSQIQSLQDTSALPNTTPAQMIDGIKKAQSIDLQRHPGEDDVTNTASAQKVAAGFVNTYLQANPSMPPDQQQKMLDSVKGMLHPVDVEKLQKPIDGKWIDYRTNAIQAHIANDAGGPNGENRFKNPDGTYNIATVEGAAQQMTASLKPGQHGYQKGEEVYQAEQAKKFAVMQNGALKDGWDNAAKGFLDSISTAKLKNPNMLYQDAEKQAISQYAGSVRPGEIEKLRDSAAKTWLGDVDGPQMRLKLALSNPDLKRGYEDAKAQIDTTYSGSAQKEQKKLAYQNLDAIAPQFKSGKQVVDWQSDQLKNVKIPGVFGMLLGGANVRKGEEQDWARQSLGGDQQVEAAYNTLQSRLGRAPSTAEMHEAIAEFKKRTADYQAKHQTP